MKAFLKCVCSGAVAFSLVTVTDWMFLQAATAAKWRSILQIVLPAIILLLGYLIAIYWSYKDIRTERRLKIGLLTFLWYIVGIIGVGVFVPIHQ
jgi:hypothetical protein